MVNGTLTGPAETVLMTSVARRYYLQGESKSDIAAHTGLSRFKIARMLDQALAIGLVRIEIGWPGAIDTDLSASILEQFGLLRAIVVNVRDDDEGVVRAGLGAAAAALLTEIVTADDVLGLAWGRSLTAMAAAVVRLAPCEVVQLTGALHRDDTQASSVDLVRDVARAGGGAAHYFHTPMIVATPDLAHALGEQPEVARALARIGSVTKAFVGIGAWHPGGSTVLDALDAPDIEALREAGVCAEISGVLIDAAGQPVATPLEDRMIGIRAQALAQIKDVTALVWGAQKAAAVRAAVASGMVHSLVLSRDLAIELLRSDATELLRSDAIEPQGRPDPTTARTTQR
jgi:DNA-binding transcriptional regulator LsrR (DeoR family)